MANKKEPKNTPEKDTIPETHHETEAEVIPDTPCEAGDAEAAPDTVTAEIIAAGKALETEKEKYIRLYAEYENFRKRTAREREALYLDIRSETILALLPVYDNLERALKTDCSDEAFYKGIEMTMTQLLEILEGMGVTAIPAVGEPFDPERHNAVMHIEDPEYGANTVAEEFQKGFILGEKVIRFSVVKVAN